MRAHSLSLYGTARNVMQMLRSRLGTAPEAAAELHAAIETIQTLWEELQGLSDDLAAERQRYADFFEYAPDGYVITEPHGQIREANRTARELLGLEADSLDGASLLNFIPEPDRPNFRGRLVAVRGRPEAEIEEWPGRIALGGAETPVCFRVRAIKVRRKNADGLCWLVRRLPG
jgi:PAS domain S-box-containing protein